MKSALLGIIAAVMLLTMETANTFSPVMAAKQNYVKPDDDSTFDYSDNSCFYVDVNNDNICDKCGDNHGNCLGSNSKHFVDKNGDGICDYCGYCEMTETRHNRHYVNTHKYDYCDNYSNNQSKRKGHGHNYQDRHCK